MSSPATATPQLPNVPLPPGYDVDVTGPTDPYIFQRPSVPTQYTINGIPVMAPIPGAAPLPAGNAPATASAPSATAGTAAAPADPPLPPGYEPTDASGTEAPKPGFLSNLWQEGVVNPLHQAGAGIYNAAAGASHLTANVFNLLDQEASRIAAITGTTKGNVFKNISDWARDQQQGAEQTAQQLSGGRQDVPSQIYRGLSGGVASLPEMGIAAELGGPIAGFAGLNALQQSDQGFLPALEGAVSGALMGGAFHFLGPAGRAVQFPLNALLGYVQARSSGADPSAALANATTTALLPEVPGAIAATAAIPGKVASAMTPSFVKALIPPYRSTLPRVQQEALSYLQGQGVPVQAGVQTGNKMIRALEATTAQMPVGAQAAGDFLTQQSRKMSEVAGRLGEGIYDTPVTPYEVAEEGAQALDKVISDFKQREDDSYKRAWRDSGKQTQRIQVGTRTIPASQMLDAYGRPVSGPSQAPVYDNVSQPVDISWLKPIAAQELPKLELQPAATQAQSAAASIFKKVLTLPDVVSAQYAEEMLKGFKEEAGYDVHPDARNYVQGMAGSFVPRLEQGIEGAIGPEAGEALRAGRRLHRERQEVIDLRKGMLYEPVQEFRKLVQSEDGGAKRLADIAKHAPDLMPRIGRAWFDTLIDLAAREGDWRNQGTIFSKYAKLGDRTKALMFPYAGLRRSLDHFFLGQKITGIPVNPSGTALTAATQAAFKNPLSFIVGSGQGFIGSKVFFTPQGIRLLTRAIENPAQAQALRNEAVRLARNRLMGIKGPPR